MKMRIVKARSLKSGDIVMLKHGARVVSRIVIHPPLALSPDAKQIVDVFFVGQSYPLYFRDDIEVDVTGHIDLEAVEYTIKELLK